MVRGQVQVPSTFQVPACVPFANISLNPAQSQGAGKYNSAMERVNICQIIQLSLISSDSSQAVNTQITSDLHIFPLLQKPIP